LNPKVHFSKTFLGFQLDSMPQPYIKSTPGGKWNWSTGGTEGGGGGETTTKEKMAMGNVVNLVAGTRVIRGRNLRAIKEAWGRGGCRSGL
jgi:hypothetical protein